jgi:hypothetical protein
MSVYSGPEIANEGLVLSIDVANQNCISSSAARGFNNAPQLVKNLITSSDTITSTDTLRLGNLSYFTAFAIDFPEGNFGGDAAGRHGITPGFNVRSGTKLYGADRALHLWVFDNNTNNWLPSSFFNGARLSGHCYDSWTGFTGWPTEVGKFVTDYNNIKSQFPNATYVVMGSHRDSGHTTDKFNVLLDLGAPSNVSSIINTGAPEWILVGRPGIGAGNGAWAFQNYSTNPDQVAHMNFAVPIFGNIQNYFSFNGSTDFISVADKPELRLSGDKTLACWVYLGGDSSGCGIAGKSNSTVAGMALGYGWNGNGFMALAWNSSNSPFISKNLTRDIQKWVFLVATQSGSIRSVYVVDSLGIRTSSSSGGTHTWNNTIPLTIGNANNGSNPAPSGTRISSIQVYNKSLSSLEVTQNFNALRGRYGI